MIYKVYSAGFKLSMVEEFKTRSISIRRFADEKDINASTFASWVAKSKRKEGSIWAMPEEVSLTPIEVTNEVKSLIGCRRDSSGFTLRIKDAVLTFSLSDLKEVLEVIRND